MDGIMKKHKVSLKKLHKLFPNRYDFKPTISNKLKYINKVYILDNKYYLAQYNNISIILKIPYIIIINIIYNGLSVIKELFPEFKTIFKAIRIDQLNNIEYEILINNGN